jgi:hypothetical protein
MHDGRGGDATRSHWVNIADTICPQAITASPQIRQNPLNLCPACRYRAQTVSGTQTIIGPAGNEN